MKSFACALAAVILTATAIAAPTTDPRSTREGNVADMFLPPPAYWVIAGHKKREVQIDARQVEGREVKEGGAKEAKESDNAIIAVSIVHIVKADGGVDAYSDYAEDADPKEILGE